MQKLENMNTAFENDANLSEQIIESSSEEKERIILKKWINQK